MSGGLTLREIREALASTIRDGVERETTVLAYRAVSSSFPLIVLEPDGGDYVDYWQSFGSSGIAVVRLSVVIVPGRADESARIRLDDFLSAGTGNGSSVVDAVVADPTLGGVVRTVQVGAVSVSDGDGGPVAVIPVTVYVGKIGAQP